MTSNLAIVLDTNVLLVALPTRSPYRPIFDHLLSATFELVISNEILAEYEEQIAKGQNLYCATIPSDRYARLALSAT